MTVENTVRRRSTETHGVELTDAAASRPAPCSSRRAATTCTCASPCSPVAARACATSCSSTTASLDGDLFRDFHGLGSGVDRMSAPYLQGAVIDFVDTIEKQGFTIDNPNAGGSCACGDSFN